MLLHTLRPYFDSLLAVLLIVASVLVGVTAYDAMLQLEQPKQAAFEQVPVGNHRWGIFYEGRCVGELRSELYFEPGTVLIGQGEVRIRYQGDIVPVRYFVGSFFNVLDQMVAMNISVEGPTGKFSAKLSDPNPIHVEWQIEQGSREISRSTRVNGPIVLRKVRKDTYRIDYSAVLGDFQQFAARMPSTAIASDTLTVSLDPQSLAHCDSTPDDALDVDPMLERFQRTFSTLQSLFQPRGGGV